MMTQIQTKTHRRVLNVGDALAYGRKDLDRVMREILVTEGIHVPNPLALD